MNIILALDLDGTLVDRFNPISENMISLLRLFQKQGAKIVFITGRMYSFASLALKFVDFPYILALQNGADIVKMPSKILMKRNYVLVKELIFRLKEIKVPYIFYTGIDKGDFCYYQKSIFNQKDLVYLEELKKISQKPWQEYHSLEEIADLSVPLVKFFGCEKELIPLEKIFSDFSASCIQDSVDKRKSILLLTSPEASKGKAVHFFKEMFCPSMIIAAGDDRNDLSLFSEADYSIAMPHAPDELKRKASEVVSKSLEESLKKFLK